MMLRGFRWQFLALILAALVFAAAIVVRLGQTPQPIPTLPPVTATAAPAGGDAVPTPSQPESVLPVTTSLPAVSVARFADGIPTFREGLTGSVARLNPVLASLNPAESAITSLIFEGLARTNAFGEPVPALAASWVISASGLEYVVTLRQDVMWHDGTPFTAADVLYTISLLRSPAFPGDVALGQFWRTVETEGLDTHIVRFRLTQPLGNFLDRLQVGILPAHALQGTTALTIAAHPFNLTPIGTGPYQLEAIRTGIDGQIETVDLRVAPNFRARPEGQIARYALERISFRLYATFDTALDGLAAGEIDALAGRTAAERRALFMLANDADLTMYNQIENALGAIIFNWQSERLPYFGEQRVRAGLATGLDRSSIVTRLLANQAVPADGPLMPGSWAYDPDLPWSAYNTAQGMALIQQGIERLERRGSLIEETPAPEATLAPDVTPTAPPTTFFTFSILTPDDPAWVALANDIAAQWSQLNLTVSVETVPADEYLARLDEGRFDTALVELALGSSADPDMYAFWHQGQYPDGRNYGGVDDRRISELLERARRDPFGINRQIDYQSFQREFAQRAIALPLYHPIFTYVTTQQVNGIQLGFIGLPADRFRTVGEWTIR